MHTCTHATRATGGARARALRTPTQYSEVLFLRVLYIDLSIDKESGCDVARRRGRTPGGGGFLLDFPGIISTEIREASCCLLPAALLVLPCRMSAGHDDTISMGHRLGRGRVNP